MGGGATGDSSDGKLHWIKVLKNGANLYKWWGKRTRLAGTWYMQNYRGKKKTREHQGTDQSEQWV